MDSFHTSAGRDSILGWKDGKRTCWGTSIEYSIWQVHRWVIYSYIWILGLGVLVQHLTFLYRLIWDVHWKLGCSVPIAKLNWRTVVFLHRNANILVLFWDKCCFYEEKCKYTSNTLYRCTHLLPCAILGQSLHKPFCMRHSVHYVFFLIFTSYLQMQMDLLRKVGAAREVNCFLLFGH